MDSGVQDSGGEEIAPWSNEVENILCTILCSKSPCKDPDASEDTKDNLRHLLFLDVIAKFCKFEERIGAVVDDEDEGADPDEVAGPGEPEEQDGHQVVDHVLHKVLPLDVNDGRDG